MKTTTVTIAVLLVACVSSEAFLSGGQITDIFKKDLSISNGFQIAFSCSPSRLETLGKSLSLACVEYLTTQYFNLTSFQDSARGLCERCGEPLFELIQECAGDAGSFLRTIDILCSTNEKGNKCYETVDSQEELFSECVLSPCSESCKRDLETSNERHGCCMFSSVALLSDVESAEQLWSRCDVSSPGLCRGAFTPSEIAVTPSTPASAAGSVPFVSGSMLFFHLVYVIASM
jgi:hypothetical protein